MHDLTLMAGLQVFWQTVTAASADICQLHDAAAAGLDTAVASGAALPKVPGAGWADTLPGGADLGAPGWPE